MNKTLIANGRRIRYQTDGPAGTTPLFLLHGFCEDAGVWDKVVDLLPDIPLIRMDLPGFGASELPVAPGMEVYAEAACAVLNDLALPKAVLAGHSMGGYAALEFAAAWPERLAGLGLIHSHPLADTPDRIEARRRGIALLQEGKRDQYVAQLFPGLFSQDYRQRHPLKVDALIRQGRQHPAEGIIAALEGMIARKDHTQTLAALNCPVLLLLGAEDALVPPDMVEQFLHLPRLGDLQLLPGVAHMSMFEATDETAAILRRFHQLCTQ
jgi:3-oxoadipate enol-lactonase